MSRSSSVLATVFLVLFSSAVVVENKLLSPTDLVVDLVSGFESKGYDDAFREIWGQPRKVDNEGQHVELSLDRSSSGEYLERACMNLYSAGGVFSFKMLL